MYHTQPEIFFQEAGAFCNITVILPGKCYRDRQLQSHRYFPKIAASHHVAALLVVLAMTDLMMQSLFCHCEEPRRGDVAISWQFVTGICRLVRLTGSRGLPRLLRSLAMTDLVVQSFCCHCEEPRRGDAAISWQFVAGICRLVRITGSPRLPRPTTSLRAPSQ